MIKTGDVLIYTSNNINAFLLKMFMSSEWSHIGIAVRLKDKKITLDQTGDLYILEINKGRHVDALTGEYIRGYGICDLITSMKIYNRLYYRPIDDKYRNQKLIDQILKFHKEYYQINFPHSFTPFVNIWTEATIMRSSCTEGNHKFCSQLAAEFYKELFKVDYQEFLPGCPENSDVINPEHFTVESSYFGEMILDIKREESLISIIVVPLLFLIFVIVIIGFFILYIYESGNRIVIK